MSLAGEYRQQGLLSTASRSGIGYEQHVIACLPRPLPRGGQT